MAEAATSCPAQRAGEHQGADASVAHLLVGYPISRGPVPVVAEHVAGDDQRVETKRVGAHAARKRARWTAFIAGDRMLGTERGQGDEVDVRTAPAELASR